jgi:hypothetical protein
VLIELLKRDRSRKRKASAVMVEALVNQWLQQKLDEEAA